MLNLQKQLTKKNLKILKRFKSKKNLETYQNRYKVDEKKIEKKPKEAGVSLELKYQKILKKEIKSKNKWYLFSLLCALSLYIFQTHIKDDKDEEYLNMMIDECLTEDKEIDNEIKKKNFLEFYFLSENETEWEFLSKGLDAFIFLFNNEREYLRDTSKILANLMLYSSNFDKISKEININELISLLKNEKDEKTKLNLGEFIYRYYEKLNDNEEMISSTMNQVIDLSFSNDVITRKIVSNFYKFFKNNEEFQNSFLKKLKRDEIKENSIKFNIDEALGNRKSFKRYLIDGFFHPLVFKTFIFIGGGTAYSMIRFNHKLSGKLLKFNLLSFKLTKNISTRNLILFIPFLVMDESILKLNRYLFTNYKIEQNQIPILVFLNYFSILSYIFIFLKSNPFLFYPISTNIACTYDRVILPTKIGLGYEFKRYNKLYY
eukprot:gene1595-12720_t